MLTRRDLLRTVSGGFGWLAFKALAHAETTATQTASPLLPKAPHFAARAKRVIFLAMQGGPACQDTFDYKPKLNADSGKPGIARGAGSKLFGSPFKFSQSGQSGLWISELFPHLAKQADEMCLVRSMHTDIPNHPQAFVQLHTGSAQFVRPSMGAWMLYGLGTENQNLPGFITINPPVQFGSQNYGSAFLPAIYQGTRIGAAREKDGDGAAGAAARIPNITNSDLPRELQRKQLDLVQAMNRDFLYSTSGDREVEGVIESFELAFRMQSEIPRVMEFTKETPETLKLYGIGERQTDGFARQCLMARRFIEAGVRFVEVCQPGWDQHQNLTTALQKNCGAIDQPIAALLQDLKSRGLLKDTLVVWGGEFGRTVYSQGKLTKDDYGRDHHPRCFSMWMAGGGIKGGQVFGETDDFSYNIVQAPVHLNELNATILRLMGIDNEQLTYKFAGLNARLTGVEGAKPVKGLML